MRNYIDTCAGGIIMSAESVVAIRDGRKTQTRRVANPQPKSVGDNGGAISEIVPSLFVNSGDLFDIRYELDNARCMKSRYQPGKIYYVKEAIRLTQSDRPDYDRAEYVADGAVTKLDTWPWKKYVMSAMVMPRGLARYVIEIDSVRVQRLQEITEEDALAEGASWVPLDGEDLGAWDLGNDELAETAKDAFASAWDRINGKRAPWSSNPWVFAYTFHMVRG